MLTKLLRDTMGWQALWGLRKRLARFAHRPPVGRVDFGDLRRIRPLAVNWGYDRGTPIDRHYIEAFLAGHREDIRHRVLEVRDSEYTRRFGAGRVTRSDVLDLSQENPEATIVADLAHAEQVPGAQFDCIICTQTLHLIYDLPRAIATLHRWLCPGGVLLATLPGICQVNWDEVNRESDHWRVTAASAHRLFGDRFGERYVEVGSYGNVLAAVAFLEGIGCEELTADELNAHDPAYQVSIAVRAVKAS